MGAGQREGGLVAGHAGEALAHADAGGEVLAVHVVQERLVVEEVELGGAAGHEEVDDALGARGEVGGVEDAFEGGGGGGFAVEERRKGGAADAQGGAGEEVSPIEGVVDVVAVGGHLGSQISDSTPHDCFVVVQEGLGEDGGGGEVGRVEGLVGVGFAYLEELFCRGRVGGEEVPLLIVRLFEDGRFALGGDSAG